MTILQKLHSPNPFLQEIMLTPGNAQVSIYCVLRVVVPLGGAAGCDDTDAGSFLGGGRCHDAVDSLRL